MNVEADFIKEALDAGLYKQAVTMFLQLLKAAGKREESKVYLVYPERDQARTKFKSMCKHFVEDEHYCYFDDMYSPEYTMQWIYEAIRKAAIKREESQVTIYCFEGSQRKPLLDRIIIQEQLPNR